ncbi:response regulator transcription factor [Dolosigranulum pigrum]|uniref:helix-turn-helix transcriptional regulator n=1 Tax=Dolosigranulum pigrum TaxID=29394 RepID=UPI001AD86C3C|nr:LuxR C-terminal-related transcriptional regulator [Dolosigranulum pigrum]QTJ37754.1 response regulator transcription factor [Dolosigranulum pigrum]
MKVLIIDQHCFSGKCIFTALTQANTIDTFYFHEPSHDLINKIILLDIDIILLVIHLETLNEFKLAKKIIDETRSKLCFMSALDLLEFKQIAYDIGAFAFFNETIDIDTLITQLKKIHNQSSPSYIINDCRHVLTSQEKLANGETQKSIAFDLGITTRTIRNHLYSINKKLDTQSTIQAIVKAHSLGIIYFNL